MSINSCGGANKESHWEKWWWWRRRWWGGCMVASAPQTAPPGKLVHKHDLTVSHSLFSRCPPPHNLFSLITVIPPASFPLSPCVYHYCPFPPYPPILRSETLFTQTHANYLLAHQSCMPWKKKRTTLLKSFHLPLTILSPHSHP